MDEERKYGKKEEQNNSQIGREVDYNIPPYAINENVPEGFPYSHWMPHNMSYGFDQQYNYYNHSMPQFYGNGVLPPGPGQDHMHPLMPEKPRGKSHGKKKIKLEYITPNLKRSVCFSKRKRGIMKKAYELNVLTGTEILLLVASESGHVFTFATEKLKPIITDHEEIIQSCLNRGNGASYGASRKKSENSNTKPSARYEESRKMYGESSDSDN